VLGRLYLEGKLVPRDVQQAANLLDQAGVWDLDARIEVVRILAGNPEVRIKNAKHLLYFATEAAELDEPGATAALIDLKLSKNGQFQDRPGACKLIETAVSRGDRSMTQRTGGLPRRLATAQSCLLRSRHRNDRYRRQTKNKGQNQDRTASPAQGYPRQ
jgi:hypothetical protein